MGYRLPGQLSKTVLSFNGDTKTYNTTADRDIDRDKGITFNAIKGTTFRQW